MFLKKLWVAVISSLFVSFVMHGAALGAEGARGTTLADKDDSLAIMGERIIQLMNSPYGQRFLHGDKVAVFEQLTSSPVKASDSLATLPQVKKSTVDQATQTPSESEIRGTSSASDDRDAKRAAAVSLQVQKNKDSVSVAKRDFDAKKHEEARRQQRTRALAAVGSFISMGAIPPIPDDAGHEPKRPEQEISSQRHIPGMRSVMAQSAEFGMREPRGSFRDKPKFGREKFTGDAIERIDAGPRPKTDKLNVTLRESLILNSPLRIKSIINIWKKYLAGKISDRSMAGISKRLLLMGAPGTGKTSMGKAIAAECGIPCFMYDGTSIATSYKDSGSNNLDKIFTHAVDNMPCVLIVDEIGALLQRYHNKHDTESLMLIKLWQLIDECAKKPILFIATANELEGMPGALESRFCNKKIKFGPPDQDERERIIEHYKNYLSEGNSKVFDGIKAADLAKKTDWFCHRHLEQLMGDALELYLERDIPASPADYDLIISRIKSSDSSLTYWKHLPQVAETAKEWGVPGHLIQLGMHAHNAYRQDGQVKLQTKQHGDSMSMSDRHHGASMAMSERHHQTSTELSKTQHQASIDLSKAQHTASLNHSTKVAAVQTVVSALGAAAAHSRE